MEDPKLLQTNIISADLYVYMSFHEYKSLHRLVKVNDDLTKRL